MEMPYKSFRKFVMVRIALKLLFYIITSSIQGINPNNQSIWLGHVRSLWILTIQKPSYVRFDHFPRIFAYPILYCALRRLHCALRRLYCALTKLYYALTRLDCCSKAPLCCSKTHVYEKYAYVKYVYEKYVYEKMCT